MSVRVRRREADAAERELQRSARAWSRETRALRGALARHRAALIVGGGAAAGLATSLLPVAPLLRLASALAGAVSLMLEGPLLRLLAAQGHDRGDRASVRDETTSP